MRNSANANFKNCSLRNLSTLQKLETPKKYNFAQQKVAQVKKFAEVKVNIWDFRCNHKVVCNLADLPIFAEL